MRGRREAGVRTRGEKKRRKGKRGHNRRYYYDEPEMKICCIEGTRTNIDKCLTQLKEK